MTHEDNAVFTISTLHDDPNLGKMGTSMISLVELSEEFRLARKWSQALGCCDELDDLAQDLDMQNIPGLDTTYATGMANMSRGAVHLSQGSLDEAEICFAEGRRCFQDASTRYSEAVALLALALVHQAQRQWTRALGTLEPSLNIFNQLGDPLKDRVLEILTDVQHSLRTDLKQGTARTERAVPPGPAPSTSPPPTPTPASHLLQPSGTLRSPARPRRRESIPLLGRIAAGESILAEDNIEDQIAIDGEIADRVDFALRVKGYSMLEVAILEGDIILIEQREDPPENGQIAAVIIPQVDDEATLKRFYQEPDHVRLGPANVNYPLIIVKPDSVPEEEIRARYYSSHPNRSLQIYSGMKSQILGWARGLIREEIAFTGEIKYQS
jgi:SOS-response transcriptional repressor LexA